MTQFKYFVGIDIASSTFTASMGTMAWKVVLKPQEFENTEDGFQTWLDWLTQHQILPDQTVICMEATGVYGEGFAHFAFAKGYRVAVQPPLEVKRAFKPNIAKRMRSTACRSLNMLLAIQINSVFGNLETKQIKVLLATCEQFVVQNTAHKNSLKTIQRKPVKTPFAEQTHSEMIELFKKQIHAIDTEVRRLIENDPTFKHMLFSLLSVPGVGLLLAAYIRVLELTAPLFKFTTRQTCYSLISCSAIASHSPVHSALLASEFF